MASRGFIFTTTLLVVIGYWLYTPTPEGYSTSSSFKLKLVLASMKVSHSVAVLAEKFGFASHVSVIRWFTNKFSPSGVDLTSITVEDTVFDGVKVRIYKPPATGNTSPGFVFYHGGGWVIGSIGMVEEVTASICMETNSVVVSVEYRLAPEHPFPAAIDDCATATKYFLSNAKRFNVDPNRVAVGGDSAGGNLAAAVSLKLRDEGFTPRIKLQILIYPVVQGANLQLPSYENNNIIIAKDSMSLFISFYLDGSTDNLGAILNNSHVSSSAKNSLAKTFLNLDKLPKKYLEGYVKPSLDFGDEDIWKKAKGVIMNPYFSPLVAESLAGLPTAYVFTAEHDVLRDETFLYVERLREAGVKVTHAHSDIGIHGMMTFLSLLPEAREEFDRMKKFLIESL